MIIDHTHDPAASSWVSGADEHPDFPVQNLPLGVFSRVDGAVRIGSAIGHFVLDLTALAEAGAFVGELGEALQAETLNALFALPGERRLALRHRVFSLLAQEAGRAQAEAALHPMGECKLHMPFRIGDYTDFYVGIHHATNVGSLFRPDNPLLPNYKYVPIGYHGRASSVRLSGTPIVRPKGQLKSPDAEVPTFEACKRLDYELELGVWVAGENELGEPVSIEDAWDRIGGFCLLNDWSARDIQAWEYQPLGPFLSKNFHSTVSPWVITAEALAPFRVEQPPRPDGDPASLPHLSSDADKATGALNIAFEAHIASQSMREGDMEAFKLSGTEARHMYWTVAQMVAHHTSNGCDLHSGDLLGSGTISGPNRESLGSLLELSRGGKDPVTLPTGETRCFLEDGDELVLTAKAQREGYRSIGFDSCSGIVRPTVS